MGADENLLVIRDRMLNCTLTIQLKPNLHTQWVMVLTKKKKPFWFTKATLLPR
jgi:hypothetical protein